MSNLSLQNIQELIQQWRQAEQSGAKFPVPLHDYPNIAGHTRKTKAFTLAKSILEQGIDYFTTRCKNPGRGRSRDLMFLSFAGLEHLCMAAKTEQGKLVREQYRQAKQKWDLVQQRHPEVAAEVEAIQLAIELEKLKLARMQLSTDTATMHGKEFALKQMGVDDAIVHVERPTIEVIDERHNVRFEGMTLTQLRDYLKAQHGIQFKTGKALKQRLDDLGRGDLVAQTLRSVSSDYVPSENIEIAIAALVSGNEQLRLGESR